MFSSPCEVRNEHFISKAGPEVRSLFLLPDMVEMMLMQNAQMNQILMQNMMLKALPSALAPVRLHSALQVDWGASG